MAAVEEYLLLSTPTSTFASAYLYAGSKDSKQRKQEPLPLLVLILFLDNIKLGEQKLLLSLAHSLVMVLELQLVH